MWNETSEGINRGWVDKSLRSPKELEKTLVYSAGGSDEVTFEDIAGLLSTVKIKYGTTSPNALTISIADKDGFVLATGSGEGRIAVDRDKGDVVGDLVVTLSGNSTDSAEVTIGAMLY